MMHFHTRNVIAKSVHSTAPDYEMHEIYDAFSYSKYNAMSKTTSIKTNVKYG